MKMSLGLRFRSLIACFIIGYSTFAFAINTDGRKTVSSSGTSEALGTGAFRFLEVCAETDNTGIIAVGFNPVANLATRTGIPLNAGDCWRYEPSNKSGDLSKIYVDSTVNSEGVTYIIYD